jgi:hypothetical protein
MGPRGRLIRIFRQVGGKSAGALAAADGVGGMQLLYSPDARWAASLGLHTAPLDM